MGSYQLGKRSSSVQRPAVFVRHSTDFGCTQNVGKFSPEIRRSHRPPWNNARVLLRVKALRFSPEVGAFRKSHKIRGR